jgi:hypothetical protein
MAVRGIPGCGSPGKTLGIVGLGAIGADMARLGAGVAMKLLGWTQTAAADRAQHGLHLVPLEHLSAAADVVMLHVSLNHQTERTPRSMGRWPLYGGDLLGQAASQQAARPGGDSLYILRASVL